jgi:hypothetical protein
VSLGVRYVVHFDTGSLRAALSPAVCAEDGSTSSLTMVEMTVQPQLTMVANCLGNSVSKHMRVKRHQSGVVFLSYQDAMVQGKLPGLRLHC